MIIILKEDRFLGKMTDKSFVPRRDLVNYLLAAICCIALLP